VFYAASILVFYVLAVALFVLLASRLGEPPEHPGIPPDAGVVVDLDSRRPAGRGEEGSAAA
jgi:hypothetical protein